MEVELTPDQRAFARQAVESGRLQNEEDAVQEALALWEERERRRVEFRATIDEARAITDVSMRELAGQVKARGRALLMAELAQAQ